MWISTALTHVPSARFLVTYLHRPFAMVILDFGKSGENSSPHIIPFILSDMTSTNSKLNHQLVKKAENHHHGMKSAKMSCW